MIRAMQRMYGADCCQNKKAEKSLPAESRKQGGKKSSDRKQKKAEIKVFRQDVIKGGNTWIISMSESENMFWTGK